MPDPSSDQTPPAPPQTLSYASAGMASDANDKLVTIARCANPQEAAMQVNALETAGIHAITTNENTSSLGIYFSGLTSIEVQVFKDDADRARETLRLATSDDVEPADDQTDSLPSVDPGGDPVMLIEVARFDTIRSLREAALLLESARIRAVPPKLVVRLEGGAGSGERFKLRVPVDEAERAAEVLQDLDDDRDEDEARCPTCGSWRVYPVGRWGATVKWFLRLGNKPAAQWDCLECRYRGPEAEFRR